MTKLTPAPVPCLVPYQDDAKWYQIVKQTSVPSQVFIDEDDIVFTLPILFVFVQEVESPKPKATYLTDKKEQ